MVHQESAQTSKKKGEPEKVRLKKAFFHTTYEMNVEDAGIVVILTTCMHSPKDLERVTVPEGQAAKG